MFNLSRRIKMKSKKVFRKHCFFQIICILGFLIFMSFLPFSVWMLILSFEEKLWWFMPFAFGFLGLCLYLWKAYIIPTLIPMTFGKLIITDEGVEFRCLFKKNTFIAWDDCEFCGIESYHSDVADLYKTGRIYVYFSTKPIPTERSNKLDMMKNNNELIKFFLFPKNFVMKYCYINHLPIFAVLFSKIK